MNTTQALLQKRAELRTQILTPDELRVMDAEAQRLRAENKREQVLSAGDMAPDFILPDQAHRGYRLVSGLRKGPVILVFYRGGWCPYCRIHLAGMETALASIQATGASLIAVSPQLPDTSQETAWQNGCSFPVLSDVGNHVATQFGLVYTVSMDLEKVYQNRGHLLAKATGQVGRPSLPMPATFVISPDQHILFAQAETDESVRSDPQDLLHLLLHRNVC